MTTTDRDLQAALTAYEKAGRPRVCPCCGAWDGPRLPMCTDEGWAHGDSCSRIRFSTDLCEVCDADD